jgi:hypothetical protein
MGFYDSIGTHENGHERTGAWVSSTPLDAHEGADGDTLLTLKIPIALFERHEWKEEGRRYREALIPAEDLNSHGEARIVSQEAEHRLMARPWRATGKNANRSRATDT